MSIAKIMENKKLLTFVVPSYNMELYLERCVRSCVCDNMELLEVIIVNDGSTDATSAIGHRLAEEFPTVIRMIDKENGHYGSCVNRGIAEATGKYFTMLDADDWCDSNALNSLLEKMKTCDTDLVFTELNVRIQYNNIEGGRKFPDSIIEGEIYDAKTFDCTKYKTLNFFETHCTFYRTKILQTCGLHMQHGICYTDSEYCFYPIDKIKDFTCYRLPVYQYMVGREGQSIAAVDDKSQREMWQIIEPMLKYYREHKAENTEAVRKNQCIVIAHLINMVYFRAFKPNATPENLRYLYMIEEILKTEPELDEIVSKGNNKLLSYRKTGKMELSWRHGFRYALQQYIYDWHVRLGAWKRIVLKRLGLWK